MSTYSGATINTSPLTNSTGTGREGPDRGVVGYCGSNSVTAIFVTWPEVDTQTDFAYNNTQNVCNYGSILEQSPSVMDHKMCFSIVCINFAVRVENLIFSTIFLKNIRNSEFTQCKNKKLIRRWDSERELSLRRHDIVHALQNTIDSCINSARDRRGYVLERRFTKVWNNAMQRPLRRSRSIKVTDLGTNRKLIYDFLLVTDTNLILLSCTVSKLWLIICQIFASESGEPHCNALAGVIPCQYRYKWYIAKN